VANVRGILLVGWAERARERFGDAVFSGIRGDIDGALPDDPEPAAWYPAQLQLDATLAILQRGFGGDEEALAAALIEDGMGSIAPAARKALKLLGPQRVLARAGAIHPHLYDVGTCEAEAGRGFARLQWTGDPLFGDPVWRLLQVAATRGLLAAAGRNAEPPTTVGEATGFRLAVRWRSR